MQKFLGALGLGLAVGVVGVFLHNDLPPFGIILAIAESGVGIWLVGRYWGARSWKILAALSWVAVVLRAASHGTSFELLIYGNSSGDLFLLFGFISVVVATVLRP